MTTFLWVLAMILPGGLPLLALWVAFKAARKRQQAKTASRKSGVDWVAPKSANVEQPATASACASLSAQA